MADYIKNEVPDCIRIRAFVSLFRKKLPHYNVTSGEAHDFWEFLYLNSGELSLMVDGELYSLSPGDMILYPPHSYHSVASTRNTEVSIISFVTESVALYPYTGRTLKLNDDMKDELHKIVETGKEMFTIRENMRGMALCENASRENMQRLANNLELFLLDLCNAQYACKKKPDREFEAFSDYLKMNIHRRLTLAEISRECAIGASTLQKMCRRQCGCGPIDYFISLKIGAAKRMMRSGDMNITQIATALGFSSVHYFSKLFKSKTGMAPSHYPKKPS